jgi:hypothetical protein
MASTLLTMFELPPLPSWMMPRSVHAIQLRITAYVTHSVAYAFASPKQLSMAIA